MTSTATTRRVANAHSSITSRTGIRAIANYRRFGALLCAFGFLAACGAPRVQPDVPGGVSLAGSWRLDHQASADPNALITAIVEKEVKRMRRRMGPDDEADSGAAGVAGETGRGPGERGSRADSVEGPGGYLRPRGGMAAYVRSHYTNALGSVLSGESLVIEQAPDRFAIRRGDSRRTFTPGAHSVVGVADGVADQVSGWKGREYVIDVRPQVGPRVTETYGLGSGGQLIEKIFVSADDDLPKLEFTRVYDKGAAPGRALPGS